MYLVVLLCCYRKRRSCVLSQLSLKTLCWCFWTGKCNSHFLSETLHNFTQKVTDLFMAVYFCGCRCFALVSNASLTQVAAMDRQVSMAGGGNTHESIMGAGISGAVHTILVQASPQIFKVNVLELVKLTLPYRLVWLMSICSIDDALPTGAANSGEG